MHEQIPPMLIVFLDQAVLQKGDEAAAAAAAAKPICMSVGRREGMEEGKTKAPHESRRPKASPVTWFLCAARLAF